MDRERTSIVRAEGRARRVRRQGTGQNQVEHHGGSAVRSIASASRIAPGRCSTCRRVRDASRSLVPPSDAALSAPTSIVRSGLSVVGSHVPSPLGRLLRLPAVPVPALADPPFSLLHPDDAATAMVEALLRRVHGPLNVVGPGAASPWQAASRGYIDDVIEPRKTRSWLIRAFAVARSKRVSTPARKHGNIPL